jgi:hypothetical protein
MRHSRLRNVVAAAFLLIGTLGFALGPSDWYEISATAELGAVKVLRHNIQLGTDGTKFDYVRQGGQEILFPFKRFSVELNLHRRHDVILLYQPLTIATKTRVPTDYPGGVVFDGVTFVPGTGLNLKYGFDFWRASYLYRIVDSSAWVVSAGASLQIRNASIVFEGTEGDAVSVNQNLGPVPILKLRTEYRFRSGAFVGTEIDGFYASSAYINGADYQFEGSILDASLRAGVRLTETSDAFVNVRFLGGTAKGTSESDSRKWSESTTNYTDNSLSTLAVTLGARLR